MIKSENLIGKKFGNLTVLENIPNSCKAKCLCDCGNYKIVSIYKLKDGTTKSCGCLRGHNRTIDLTGEKFGRLKVVERISNVKGRVAWRCICECGNEKICTTQLLRRGSALSCGCLNSELSSERRFVDLSGRKFGKLLVLEKSGIKHNHILWKCQCDCGNITYATTDSLQQENKRSCGCSQFVYDETEILKKSAKHRLKVTWRNMINRCYDKSNISYKNYGGRGITVCNEWRNDFQKFYEWAVSNGYDKNKTRKEQSIDRMDNNGNYEPSNCRWADAKTQVSNRN